MFQQIHKNKKKNKRYENTNFKNPTNIDIQPKIEMLVEGRTLVTK